MPDLGPAPPRDQLTAEQIEAMRLEQLDSAWDQVVTAHPNAVRPDVHFAGYLTTENHTEVMSACFTEMGVPFGLGTDMDGNVAGMEWTTDVEEHAVGAYVCQGRHRSQPIAPPNNARLGWLYDYLTQFLVPCYEANGIKNSPPPTRDDFVANWPHQDWFPSQGHMPMGTDLERAIDEACPPPA